MDPLFLKIALALVHSISTSTSETYYTTMIILIIFSRPGHTPKKCARDKLSEITTQVTILCCHHFPPKKLPRILVAIIFSAMERRREKKHTDAHGMGLSLSAICVLSD